MRIIMGVDSNDDFKPVLYLTNALDFHHTQLTLLHAANPQWAYVPTLPVDPIVLTDLTTEVENVGRRALDEARDTSCRLGLPTKTMLTFGNPADVLEREAKAENADLIAVTATHHGMWSTSFLGSISRVLAASSEVSCLVAKGGPKLANPKIERPIKAVFATDHSEFANRCLDHLIRMRPQGIGAIHVVSAYDMNDFEEETLNRNLPVLGGNVAEWVLETVEANNKLVAEKLHQAGYQVTHQAVRGRPNEILREAMQDSRADLMIVGAQGKGFMERVLIGSVSLHQVVSEPYPVLVIRP